MFSRVLIANRGEIALRVIRACKELGIETVAVYSTADKDASYLDFADHKVCIGPGPAAESYLNIPRIIAAAEVMDVDAIHPGYGFLSENSHFAEVCESCNIEFIGPSSEAMQLLGDKVSCKRLAIKNKVPTFPGSKGAIKDEKQGLKVAEEIGYPVIIKAAFGGGGRGMRVVHNKASLKTNLQNAISEAEGAFGNGTVYIEKFLEKARHVEVQVLGDAHGNAVHLFERDCTMQRRHQKLLEEAPCPVLDAKTRQALCRSAVRLVKGAKYRGAATVEYLLDNDNNFYLLEVNTRVQVEHPVTEMVTGIDIVKTMIQVSAGEELPYKQSDIKLNGAAIEARINAEDSERNFAPQPGLVEEYQVPGGLGVRVDSHCHAGYRIPPNYDSMIGKLIVHGDDREQAIARLDRALSEFKIGPIKTTIPLHLRLLRESHFPINDTHIHYVEHFMEQSAK